MDEIEKPSEPRILFTHIPLFRPETTPCGEARESRQLILDRNGEQYQNMVNASLSQEILRKIQPDMVFSGDDHDWCEMGHSLDGRLIPEVTLPTFSFAQGVAQTGFVVLSLYNPQHISRNARSLTQEDNSAAATMPATAFDSHTAKVSDMTTFAYDECKLPKQLVIYSGYSCMLLVTLLWLIGYQFWWLRQSRRCSSDSVFVRNETVATSAMSSNRFSGPPHPLLGSTTTQEEKHFSTQEVTEALRQQQKLEASSASNDNEGRSVDSPRTFSSSHSISRSPLSPVFSPSSTLSPLMNYMKIHSILRRIWPLQRGHFWTIVAWDLWEIVRYVIPFYFLLILAALQ